MLCSRCGWIALMIFLTPHEFRNLQEWFKNLIPSKYTRLRPYQWQLQPQQLFDYHETFELWCCSPSSPHTQKNIDNKGMLVHDHDDDDDIDRPIKMFIVLCISAACWGGIRAQPRTTQWPDAISADDAYMGPLHSSTRIAAIADHQPVGWGLRLLSQLPTYPYLLKQSLWRIMIGVISAMLALEQHKFGNSLVWEFPYLCMGAVWEQHYGNSLVLKIC